MHAQHSTVKKPQQPPPPARPKLIGQTTPSGTVLSSIRVSSVLLAVLLSIHVISVRVHIQSAVVIFVPQVQPCLDNHTLPSPSLPRLSPLSLKLPTPVRIDRLEFLLSGYIHSITEFMSSGFRTGFPLHYVGVRESADANNFIPARQHFYKIPVNGIFLEKIFIPNCH